MKLYEVHCFDQITHERSILGTIMLWEKHECEERFGHEYIFEPQNKRLIDTVVIAKFPYVWGTEVNRGLYEYGEWDNKNKRIIEYSKTIHLVPVDEGSK